MRRIVAIGGGESCRAGCPAETTTIDEEIVRLTGKSSPKVLFLPTASCDAEQYCQTFKEHFGGRLGCMTDVLRLLGKQPPDQQTIRRQILGSDAVYVGGGNSAMMLRAWRRFGVDAVLREACDSGIVLSGLSAGAICWFRFGCSDSRKFARPGAPLMRVSGLGFVGASFCPHYDVEPERPPMLEAMMGTTPGVAIALGDCCAIQIDGDLYRVLKSSECAQAYRIFWSRGVCHKEVLPDDADYRPLRNLLIKPPRLI